MSRTNRSEQMGFAGFVVLAIIVIVVPSLISDYALTVATQVGVYFIAILSLNLLLGFAGQISLGQGALMLVGAYATGLMSLHHHWTIIETLPIAFLVSFGVGALLGLPALRLGGIYLALVTFAFAFAMPTLPNRYANFFGGGNGIQFHTESDRWAYNVTWIVAGIALAGTWLLLRGRTGRAFRSIRDSETAAVSSGISLPVYKVLAFAVSGGLAGIAGSMQVVQDGSFISPGSFTVFLSLAILIGAAVAGLGSLWGALIGALFIGVLPDLATSVPVVGSSHGRDIVFAVVVMLIIVLMPNGFAGLLRALVLRLTRAQRQAAATPPSPPAATPPAAEPA